MKNKWLVIAVMIPLIFTGVFIAAGVEYTHENNNRNMFPDFTAGTNINQPRCQQEPHRHHKNLTEISGILENTENSFIINNTSVLFGSEEVIAKQAAAFDYDGDEIIETVQAELKGLIGSNVIVKGELNEENQFIVFEMNKLPVGRPPHHPPPKYQNADDLKDYMPEPRYD